MFFLSFIEYKTIQYNKRIYKTISNNVIQYFVGLQKSALLYTKNTVYNIVLYILMMSFIENIF
jgi:hypothetical protein